MKKQKLLGYLFLTVGILNFIMMIDTILTDKNQSFSIFSYSTGKEINIAFFAIIGSFLIYLCFSQNKNLKKNEDNKY